MATAHPHACATREVVYPALFPFASGAHSEWNVTFDPSVRSHFDSAFNFLLHPLAKKNVEEEALKEDLQLRFSPLDFLLLTQEKPKRIHEGHLSGTISLTQKLEEKT